METVSGGNASVISLDSESEVVIDTALNELEQLAHKKSLVEDGSFALKTISLKS